MTPCPICGLDKHMAKAKPLYEVPVCRKCYFRYANRRQFAFVIDILGLTAVSFASAMAVTSVYLILLKRTHEQIMLQLHLLGLALGFAYVLKDAFRGQSPGKALLGVRVIDAATGQPGTLRHSFRRNLPLILNIPVWLLLAAFLGFDSPVTEGVNNLISYAIILAIGFQLCKGRRWGDGWANTVVVWDKHRDKAPFSQFPVPTA